MTLKFSKYHGTGNDFILLDNRSDQVQLSTEQVAFLCHRRFGIGADGLMLLEELQGFDFKMVYYNSDGRESSMCGNGGRCITAFAHHLGIIKGKTHFTAIDGSHTATIDKDGIISLHMQDVTNIADYKDYCILNTGSPHFITWVDDVKQLDVVQLGREIRNRNQFMPGGINANFVQRMNNGLWVRTYERGVEDETYSCGTGVTAAAIAATGEQTGTFNTPIFTPGGNLFVSFTKDTATSAKNVVLIGPAVFVFEGTIEL
jgi:diaminopimelate epimerase